MLDTMEPHDKVNFYVPLCTDNQGNAYSILKESSRKWPCSAFLMELFLQAAHSAVHLRAYHSLREQNTWADSLVNNDISAFDPQKEVGLHKLHEKWILLQALLALGGPFGEQEASGS